MFHKERKNAVYIQRKWREYFEIDPVSFERIQLKFTIFRGGKQYNYDANTLASYILASADFTDPIARLSYSSTELQALDDIVGSNFMNNKEYIIASRRERDDRESILNALENELYSTLDRIEDIENEESFKHDIMPLVVQCIDNIQVVSRVVCRRVLFEAEQYTLNNFQTSLFKENVIALLNIMQVSFHL